MHLSAVAPRDHPTNTPGAKHWLFAETAASRRACLTLGVGGLLALLTMILSGPRHLVYDEVFHLTTAKVLLRTGISREFLMGTPWSAPGPLFALVQVAFSPLTGLRPPGIRLVNFACVLGMLALLARTLHARGVSAPVNVALGILAAIMGWTVFGIALTEAPAMLCAAGGILLTVLWLREDARPVRRDLLAVGAGLLLGASVAGRQVFLAALPATVLLARRGAVRPVILQLAASALLPGALFFLRGGLAPAEMRFASQGLRPSSAVLAYAYTGMTTLLLAPRFFLNLPRRWITICATTTLVANLALGFYAHLPLKIVLAKHLSAALITPLARLWGGLLLALAVVFIAAMLKGLWDRREDRLLLFTGVATLLLALTPIKITHVWDVRYVSIVLPYLVVALSGWVTSNYARAIRLAFGMVLAALLLYLNMQTVWDDDNPPTMREIFASGPRE